MAKSFILSAGGNLGRPIGVAGCQRAHGARGQKIEMLGEFDAAFAHGRAGDAVAAGDGGHRIARKESPLTSAKHSRLRRALRSAINCRPAGFGDRRKAMLQDIAVLTGAEVISPEVA